MSVTLKYTLKDFNEGKIVNKFNMQKGGSAQLFLSNECFRRMDKYVPKDTGLLKGTVTVKPGSVTYEQPYAHRQYTTNKGKGLRGKYWDQKMLSAEKQLLVSDVEKYVKEHKKW